MKSLRFLVVFAALAASPLSHAGNVTIYRPDISIIPAGTLPPPNAAAKSDKIIELFNTLGRTTRWDLVDTVRLEGDTGEPEGMVVLGERYFVSSGMYTAATVSFNGSIINGTDRTAGAGTAHLLVFDGGGTRIADAALSSAGDVEYHVGGIDYDGRHIWATVAQYRPNTTAHVVRIDPRTLDATTLFHARDHFGGIVVDTREERIVGLNWGSRNASTWRLGGSGDDGRDDSTSANSAAALVPSKIVRNPEFWVDYQDCKFLGHPRAYEERGVMICSGVTKLGSAVIGGVALVDAETMVPLSEVPLTMTSELGALVTSNPMDVDVVNGRLRFYFVPDQRNSTVYVFEANPESPVEF